MMHFVTVASSPHSGLDRLLHSAVFYGIDLKVLGLNQPYRGNGTKIHHLTEFSAQLDPTEIVLYTDAYDSVFLAEAETLEVSFRQFQSELVFSAEQNFHLKGHPLFYIWQNWRVHRRYPRVSGSYRFLNAGSFVGSAGRLATLADELLIRPDTPSDQSVFSRHYCDHPEQYHLDHQHELMTCNGGRIGLEDQDYSWVHGRLRNNRTESFPGLLHVPGKNEESMKRILRGAPFATSTESSPAEQRLYKQRSRLHGLVDATVGDNFLLKAISWNLTILTCLVVLFYYYSAS